jgi:signal transduction histidine kinase
VLPKILKNLAFQFGVVLVVLTATPLVITAVNLIGVNRTGIENATMELYSSTAEMAALEVDSFVKGKQEPARRLSTFVDVPTGALEYSTVVKLEELFKHDPSLKSVLLYDDSNREIITLTKGKATVAEPETVSTNGTLNKGFEDRTSSYFRNINGTLELVTYTHLLNGGALVIINKTGELTSAIDGHRFGRSGAVCLVDDTGLGLYRPEYDDLPNDIAGYSNFEQLKSFLKLQVYGTSEGNTADGRRALVAFAPTSDYDGGIIVHQLYNDAYYSSIMLRKNSIIGVIIGTVLAAFVAIMFSTYLTRPMRRLTTASRRVAKGDYKVRVESNRSDEIGELITTFNDMAESLEEKEELARSNVELEHFAYVASHDLQEPLRMVTTYLSFLEEGYKDRLDEDADEYIGFAVDGATRMKRLINDLLEYSRVGTKGKEFEPVDCNNVLDTVLTNLETNINETDAVMTHEKLPVVMGDDTQLGQLFQNLISNAIKFRSDEPPKIDISAEKKDNEWVFSIRDNGIGIEKQYAQRIFLLFQRLHGIDEYSGTGIGLAVCKKIVERHGGIIWVESEAGIGSTFYFTLPLRESIENEVL